MVFRLMTSPVATRVRERRPSWKARGSRGERRVRRVYGVGEGLAMVRRISEGFCDGRGGGEIVSMRGGEVMLDGSVDSKGG